MKTIVALTGSPKPLSQSKTYAVIDRFIQDLKIEYQDITTEIIPINQKNITPCSGCLVCKQTAKCVYNDDMEHIQDSMRKADILIFASPVHFTHVSSIFHGFVERSSIFLHTFAYLGKPFINVVSTNGSGEQEADKFLSKVGYLFGCLKIGSILNSENDKFDVAKYTKLIHKTSSVLSGKIFKPKLVNKVYFSFMRNLMKKNKNYFPAENKIWENKNWFNLSYQKIYTKQYQKI
jgi:multimeric flavodoxin WrbA